MSTGSVETVTEKVSLPSNGTLRSFTVGRNVLLLASDDEKRDRDSDKSNSKVLCEYKWDPKTVYDGRILSARQKLVAYRLFNEQTGEAIRVMERESRARHLIKDFRQPVVDILFADHAGYLAVLDKNANLYIYHVSDDGNELTKYLNIIRPNHFEAPNPKIVWCTYMEDETVSTHVLAVYYNKTVEIFFLHAIKKEFGLLEVKIEELDVNSECFIQIQTESNISAVRISPDATACAVTTTSGEFIFYILENHQGREAHNLHPLKNLYVNDMLFLDNLQRNGNNSDGPYWKYVVLISDNGRRLGIYSCYNWECVGKLRFESGTSKLDATIDPTARFIYLADYETSNLFVLELAPAFPGIQPYFVACSQISFHQQIICVAPCGLEDDVSAETEDLLLDDESFKASKVCATFAAITNRSLVEIKVEVEKALDIALNEDPETGARIIGEKLAEQTKQLMLSSQRLRTSSAASNEVRSPRDETLPSFNSSADPAVHTELRQLRKLLQAITEKNNSTEKRLNDMNIQLEKVHKDNADLRREQTDNLADVLEKICRFWDGR
uniref:Ge1_WD40 domain-containing protein n=1 Tax=Bursaphelenchus xylophilus TaxID=6326 RepID=A0A1I7S6U1_BURXY